MGVLPVAGGFRATVTLQSIRSPERLRYLSSYTHLACVPREPPDWAEVGLLLLVIGVVIALRYHRRDLRT
ncbi:hypothetical protein CFP75_15965 [Amycolatopsis alba DSM 44262]|uniref:Uncharacterized protein n=1 Tax=Amycolatopsis alba DSM 44262 TaxID=1125972 RepID=A0A229RUP2_AMYAL|nr:hypothetical protein CFP75_15965 [Amycolatopsis alba DSM 44262]